MNWAVQGGSVDDREETSYIMVDIFYKFIDNMTNYKGWLNVWENRCICRHCVHCGIRCFSSC